MFLIQYSTILMFRKFSGNKVKYLRLPYGDFMNNQKRYKSIGLTVALCLTVPFIIEYCNKNFVLHDTKKYRHNDVDTLYNDTSHTLPGTNNKTGYTPPQTRLNPEDDNHELHEFKTA